MGNNLSNEKKILISGALLGAVAVSAYYMLSGTSDKNGNEKKEDTKETAK